MYYVKLFHVFRTCNLYQFLVQYVCNDYLKRKSSEVIDHIEAAVRASDAWKTTVLLDLSSDYKPLLAVSVKCVDTYYQIQKFK